MQTKAQVEQVLIQALHEERLAEVSRKILASDPAMVEAAGRALARAALETCRAIGAYCAAEERAMVGRFLEAGIPAEGIGPGEDSPPRPDHQIHLRIPAENLDRALAISAQEGFTHWYSLAGGGAYAYRRTHTRMVLIKPDDVTMRMALHWGAPRPASRLTRLFRPTVADYRWLSLPPSLWRMYPLVRPLRLVAERLGGRKAWDVGPFLGTPTSLIPPLLEFANVTANDMILDLGCGDGRIVIEAARLCGGRGLGIERDGALIQLARARAAALPECERVQFVHGDAAGAAIESATVVFLFLPVNTIRAELPGIYRRLRPGARIVVHEHEPVITEVAPHRSELLITGSSVTVAHLWTRT